MGNTLKMLFTLMSSAGKKKVFTSRISKGSVCFLQKWAWNVLVFKENHGKIKTTGWIHMFSCDIIEGSNWWLRCIDCFPSCFLSVFNFFLCCRIPSNKQKCGTWGRGHLAPLTSLKLPAVKTMRRSLRYKFVVSYCFV